MESFLECLLLCLWASDEACVAKLWSHSWSIYELKNITAVSLCCYEENGRSSFSYFLKTVVLNDWWLIKSENDVEGKSLAVAGYTSIKQQAQRLFCSAPITKRYDVFTLETADDVTVILQGFINRDRTLESGFSSEVFNRFLFGFPPQWEECVEKFFKKADVAGVKDSSLISSLSKDDVISEDDCIVDVRGDCSQNVPEKFDVGASEGNFEDHAATVPNSGQEEMNISNNNPEGTKEMTISHEQGNPSILKSPVDKSVATVRTNALGNNASSSGCHIISVNSTEVGKVVLAIPSSQVVGTKQRKKTIRKTKSKGSPCAEGMESCMNASAGCAVLNSSSYDQRVSVGTSGLMLTVSLNKPKTSNRKPREYETDKDAFEDVITNFSDVSLVQGYGQNKETNELSVAEVSTFGGSNVMNESVNNIEDAGENAITPPIVERDTVNPVPRNSVSRKSTKLLSNLKNKSEQKHVSGCSAKYRRKPSKPPPTPHSLPLVNIADAMKRASSRLRSGEWSLNSKEKNEQKGTSKIGSSTRRKISFDAQKSPATDKREEKTSIQSPELSSLKRSRSGRLLLPVLDFWKNQIPVYDADRNIIGIQEETVDAKRSRGSKSEPQKKQKRRR